MKSQIIRTALHPWLKQFPIAHFPFKKGILMLSKNVNRSLRPGGLALGAVALFLFNSAAVAAPPNDNFANATVIPASLPITVTGTNVMATRESGEPRHTTITEAEDPDSDGGVSVWWSWTPAVSGSITLSTENSGSTDGGADPFVDTQVGVYTGSSVGALTTVVKMEDSSDTYMHGWTLVTFNVVAGTTYRIAVDGWRGAQGRIQLSLAQGSGPPPPPPTKYPLTINIAPVGAGTVVADPPQPAGGYDVGAVVTLTATVSGANVFSSWGDAGSGSTSSITITMNGPKTVTAIFNSDHGILFQNTNNRQLAIWSMQGTSFLGSTLLRGGQATAAGWQTVCMADFDNNGSSDLLFQHTDGRPAVWLMNGTTFLSSALLNSPGPNWRVVGAGNFNGDISPDLVFQHIDRRVAIWLMNGTSFSSSVLVNGGQPIEAGWRAAGAADLTGDGKTDIVFQHTDGRSAIWQMNGTLFMGFVLLRNGQPAAGGWRLNGFANFNNTGSTDLFWQHNDGRLAVWFMSNTNLAGSTLLRSVPPAWRVTGAD